MGLFVNKQKIFLSHKRENGNASSDALLIKDYLDKNFMFQTFMDVHEDTLGEFPRRLKEKIDSSQTFIFIVPSDGNVSFLYNKDGWVYKEIYYALLKYIIGSPNAKNNDSFQILPVTFANSFNWPKDLPQGISKLCDFDVCKLHRNEKPEVNRLKLFTAIKRRPWWKCVKLDVICLCLIILCSLCCYVGHKIGKYNEEREIKERISHIRSSWKNQRRILPARIIPISERTAFEDSIFYFFVFRDSIYNLMENLPEFKLKVKADDFTRINLIKLMESHVYLSESNKRLMSYCQEVNDNMNKHLEKNKEKYTKKDLIPILIQYMKLCEEYESFINFLKEESELLENTANDVQNCYNHKQTENAFLLIKKLYSENLNYWMMLDRQRDLYQETTELLNKFMEVNYKNRETNNVIKGH